VLDFQVVRKELHKRLTNLEVALNKNMSTTIAVQELKDYFDTLNLYQEVKNYVDVMDSAI